MSDQRGGGIAWTDQTAVGNGLADHAPEPDEAREGAARHHLFPFAALMTAADLIEAQAARIAELEASVAAYETELSAVMPPDFKDWHENARSEWPQVAAWVIRNQREHAAADHARIEQLEARIAELEEQLTARDAEPLDTGHAVIDQNGCFRGGWLTAGLKVTGGNTLSLAREAIEMELRMSGRHRGPYRVVAVNVYELSGVSP